MSSTKPQQCSKEDRQFCADTGTMHTGDVAGCGSSVIVRREFCSDAPGSYSLMEDRLCSAVMELCTLGGM